MSRTILDYDGAVTDLEIARRLSATMASTWPADPLLGAVPPPEEGDDVVGAVADPGGTVVGIARRRLTPSSAPLSLWTATSTDVLQLRWGPEAASDDVAAVLDRWLALPAAPVDEPDGDHAHLVRLPVAAHALVAVPLLERGFGVATTTLVRPARAADADLDPTPPDGVRVRPSGPGDRAPMAGLMQELLDTEVAFGAVRQRRRGLGDHYVDEALSIGDGWTVVATADGEVVGWASMSPPEECRWVRPSVAVDPIAYLGIATVTATRRSRGVGRLLAASLHRRAAEAGVAATVVDASALNPWSMPFWHRNGYRPLWATWQRRAR